MLKTPAGGQTALAGFEKKLTGNVPDDSDIPSSVRKAVRFMLAGAATTAILGIFLLIATIVNRNALTDSTGKKLSNTAFTSGVVGTIVTYAILVTIWILMARLNRAGRTWARILASVFCALATLGTYQLINSLRGGETITVIWIVYLALAVLYWLFGVFAIALLWRTESTLYFRERTALR
jgi:hypothetical protein